MRLSYRRIANLLNEQGITTAYGKKWSSALVHSVIKRFGEKQERLRVRNLQYSLTYSKMWLE